MNQLYNGLFWAIGATLGASATAGGLWGLFQLVRLLSTPTSPPVTM